MKFKTIFGMLLFMLPGLAFAQDPAAMPQEPSADEGVVNIQINQPVTSKKFGKITLPFSWKVEENEERLTATEAGTEIPAIFAIDMIKYPSTIPEKNVVDAIAHSLAEDMNVQDVIVSKHTKTSDCGKKKCPDIVYYTTELEGAENGVPRKCALEIFPSKGQVVTLSICAEASIRYSMTLPEILHQIFEHMK